MSSQFSFRDMTYAFIAVHTSARLALCVFLLVTCSLRSVFSRSSPGLIDFENGKTCLNDCGGGAWKLVDDSYLKAIGVKPNGNSKGYIILDPERHRACGVANKVFVSGDVVVRMKMFLNGTHTATDSVSVSFGDITAMFQKTSLDWRDQIVNTGQQASVGLYNVQLKGASADGSILIIDEFEIKHVTDSGTSTTSTTSIETTASSVVSMGTTTSPVKSTSLETTKLTEASTTTETSTMTAAATSPTTATTRESATSPGTAATTTEAATSPGTAATTTEAATLPGTATTTEAATSPGTAATTTEAATSPGTAKTTEAATSPATATTTEAATLPGTATTTMAATSPGTAISPSPSAFSPEELSTNEVGPSSSIPECEDYPGCTSLSSSTPRPPAPSEKIELKDVWTVIIVSSCGSLFLLTTFLCVTQKCLRKFSNGLRRQGVDDGDAARESPRTVLPRAKLKSLSDFSTIDMHASGSSGILPPCGGRPFGNYNNFLVLLFGSGISGPSIKSLGSKSSAGDTISVSGSLDESTSTLKYRP